MDTATITRIRSSFQAVAPQAQKLVDTFYDRLFATAPAVRPMFPKDMAKQKQHLLAAISLVVKNADKFDSLRQPLMEMGARHVGYGAKPEHYPVVRDVLLGTLKDIAGPAWNAQLTADWTGVINAVAGVMLEGAANAQRKAA